MDGQDIGDRSGGEGMTDDDGQPRLEPMWDRFRRTRPGDGGASEVRQMLIRFRPPASAATMAQDLTAALGLTPAVRRHPDGSDVLTVAIPLDLRRLLRQVAEVHGGRIERDEPMGPTPGADGR